MATQIRDGEIAMMGQHPGFQQKLFYHQINLDIDCSLTFSSLDFQNGVHYNLKITNSSWEVARD
jgi:hypothetical protein